MAISESISNVDLSFSTIRNIFDRRLLARVGFPPDKARRRAGPLIPSHIMIKLCGRLPPSPAIVPPALDPWHMTVTAWRRVGADVIFESRGRGGPRGTVIK